MITRGIHELHLHKILQLLFCEYSEFMMCVTQIAWSLEKYWLNFHSALVQGDGQGSTQTFNWQEFCSLGVSGNAWLLHCIC